MKTDANFCTKCGAQLASASAQCSCEETDDYEYDADDSGYSVRDRIDELEAQIGELHAQEEIRDSSADRGLSLGYALGMAIAVVLSWSRNASILWCILHGVLSWGYVIYFAVTR